MRRKHGDVQGKSLEGGGLPDKYRDWPERKKRQKALRQKVDEEKEAKFKELARTCLI